MVEYKGWECAMCKGPNPVTRNRCRKCGRKKTEAAIIKQFYREDRRKRALPFFNKKKGTVKRVQAKKNP